MGIVLRRAPSENLLFGYNLRFYSVMTQLIAVNNYSSEELIPDELWERIKPLLPKEKNKGKGTKGGRPNVDPRRAMNAIFHVLRTGCQWKAIPPSLGSGSTAHSYYKKWRMAGVFESIQRLDLVKYKVLIGINLDERIFG